MGRGRQRAKQTKVARELKYYSPQTNLTDLERELAGSKRSSSNDSSEDTWSDRYYSDEDSYASER